ncbi:MAG: peptidylprolyl isomerase [Pseudomonadales bacterium]
MLEKKPFAIHLFIGAWVLCAASFCMADNPKIAMQTSHGEIIIELFEKESPITVANFLSYVDKKFYDNTIFHRVIPNFMIQGGGFDVDKEEKPTDEPIVNESKNRVHNERGTIAMARTNDPDSATAQFFINVRMNIKLDYRMGEAGYTVFGKVVEGMATVDDIAIQETGIWDENLQDLPIEAVVIKSVRRLVSTPAR